MKSNVLFILGGVFAVSMLGRSFALNDAGEEPAKQKPVEVAQAQPEEDAEIGDVCVTGPILQSFREQRAALEAKEQKIAERERTLEAVEKRIEERLAALDLSNSQLAEKVELLQRTAKEDITHLTSMYESMKPDQASVIFNQMDSVFAAGFLREMRSEQAGLILASMTPDKAYEISIIIASKNSELRPTVR